jgi:hypothetical protein
MEHRQSYPKRIRVRDLEDDFTNFMNFVCYSESDDYKKSIKKSA